MRKLYKNKRNKNIKYLNNVLENTARSLPCGCQKKLCIRAYGVIETQIEMNGFDNYNHIRSTLKTLFQFKIMFIILL